MNFGKVAVGQVSAKISLTFEFDSAGKLSSAPSVVTQGAASLDFVDAGTGTCTTNDPTYAYSAGENCTVDVEFSPKSAGARKGAVILEDGSGNAMATAYVYGIGSGPMVAFGPGISSTMAGNYGMGAGYFGDGGQATGAQLNFATDIAMDGLGNLYIADSFNYVIRKVTPSGTISTVAGNGTYNRCRGNDNIPATSQSVTKLSDSEMS